MWFPHSKTWKNLLLKAKGNYQRQENHYLKKLRSLCRKQVNNKTQVSETFCIICHNYKEEIDKL